MRGGVKLAVFMAAAGLRFRCRGAARVGAAGEPRRATAGRATAGMESAAYLIWFTHNTHTHARTHTKYGMCAACALAQPVLMHAPLAGMPPLAPVPLPGPVVAPLAGMPPLAPVPVLDGLAAGLAPNKRKT